jgi:hypothetical protein
VERQRQTQAGVPFLLWLSEGITEVGRPHCYGGPANGRPQVAHFVRFWVAQEAKPLLDAESLLVPFRFEDL